MSDTSFFSFRYQIISYKMSYLPLAPRQWEHNRQAADKQPFTDLVRILLLTILTQSPHLTRGAAGVSLGTLPCRGFRSAVTVLRAPPGEESTCYAVYSVVKVLCRESLQVQDTMQLPSLSMESGYN